MDPFRRKDREGWWIRWKDAGGKWRTRKGGDTLKRACAALERKETKARMIREGYLRPEQAESAEGLRRSVREVIEEYRAYLADHGRSAAHVREAIRCIRVVVEWIGAKSLGDVQQRPVERWLTDLIRRGRSARTRNIYLTRLSAMLNWAVKRGMAEKNPLAVIEHLAEQVDRREISRALTPEEFNRLIEETPSEDRQLYYLLAGRTGLRWSEIRRLRWQDVDLENGWLHLDAGSTKAKRADSLPLAPDVLERLREREKSLGPIFRHSPTRRTFMYDLERAGIPYENERGQVDRKSLRKTFGTHLARAGVKFQTMVKLMRHSDPRLTMNVYTDPVLLDMQGAIKRLYCGMLPQENEAG